MTLKGGLQPVGTVKAFHFDFPGKEIMADHIPYVVEDECIACGACEEICPEVFTVNDTLGFAQVMNPTGAPDDKIQEAIDACPVQCIHWADEMG